MSADLLDNLRFIFPLFALISLCGVCNWNVWIVFSLKTNKHHCSLLPNKDVDVDLFPNQSGIQCDLQAD